MRFVNCARNNEEENLIAFQFRGEIYYKTFKPVSKGQELLVYYGDEYAKDLGIGSDGKYIIFMITYFRNNSILIHRERK